MDQDLLRFRKAVKLILLMQATLEQMDELKDTGVYRQDIKHSMNTLEKKLERFVRPHIKELAGTDEFLMMQIQRGIDKIVSSTLEDIHNYNTDSKDGAE